MPPHAARPLRTRLAIVAIAAASCVDFENNVNGGVTVTDAGVTLLIAPDGSRYLGVAY